MEQGVYRQFYELEQRHWWFAGMRAICRVVLARFPLSPEGARPQCLDLGCGTGLWTKELEQLGDVCGLDLVPEALTFCRSRGVERLIQGSAERLPVATSSCHLVTALGLIEHIDDDAGFVAEVARVTRPGGYVLLLTSAYQALWSEHDEIVHHKRRYTKAGLARLMSENGLEVARLTYVNSLLLPAILFFRWVRQPFRRTTGVVAQESPDFFPLPAAVNRILLAMLKAERLWLAWGDLPCGVGLLAIGRRPVASGADVPREGELCAVA